MKRLKILPLSLRGKKRYVKVVCRELFPQNFEISVSNSFKKLFGMLGFSFAKIKIVYKKEREIIFKCSHEYVPYLIVAICIASFGTKTFPKIRGISGSIKKLKAK